MAGTRRRFSAEFKRGLARRDGVSVAEVARELDVGGGVLRRWIKQFDSGRWAAIAWVKPEDVSKVGKLLGARAK